MCARGLRPPWRGVHVGAGAARPEGPLRSAPSAVSAGPLRTALGPELAYEGFILWLTYFPPGGPGQPTPRHLIPGGRLVPSSSQASLPTRVTGRRAREGVGAGLGGACVHVRAGGLGGQACWSTWPSPGLRPCCPQWGSLPSSRPAPQKLGQKERGPG